MLNSQRRSLLLLGVAVVLFFFSLTLLPIVEQYCRLRQPATVLLVLQIVLLAILLRAFRASADRALITGAFVFSALGIVFSAALLVTTRGKC